MEIDRTKGPKPGNLIAALSEGILGYILYQARCGMQQAYSEYLLYDPIVRIGNHKGWKIEGEFTIDQIDGPGDNPKIDFLCTSGHNDKVKVGLEIKYLKKSNSTLSLKKDVEKLKKLVGKVNHTKLLGFIIIAGKHTRHNEDKINKEKTKFGLEDYYEINFTNQFQTNYGVTVFKVCESKL